MGLIAEEIKELRQMVKHLDAGKITPEQVRTKLSIFKATHDRAKLYLDLFIATGQPHLVENRLHSLNLISKGELIQAPSEIELEMIICPDKNDMGITRQECLSFSGAEVNHENCKSCNHYGITRKLLLPLKKNKI